MLKSKSQNTTALYSLFIITGFSLVYLVSGCATIKEGAKGVAGISTKALEDSRASAIIKTLRYDYNSCYGKVKGLLKENGSYIYKEDSKKGILAVYLSEQDTTPVGVFFKQVDATNTQVEVSSPSSYAKELIAKAVFSALEKPAGAR